MEGSLGCMTMSGRTRRLLTLVVLFGSLLVVAVATLVDRL